MLQKTASVHYRHYHKLFLLSCERWGFCASKLTPVPASRQDFPGSPPPLLALHKVRPPYTCGVFAPSNLPRRVSRFLQGRSPSSASKA